MMLYPLLLSLFVTCKLTEAQLCSGRSECGDPIGTNPWMSNIMASRGATLVQLDWDPDPQQVRTEAVYQVAFNEVQIIGDNIVLTDIFTIFDIPIGDTSFTLDNLYPGAMYEVLVCRPNVFDVTTVDTFGLPECGFCVVCFQTDPLRIRFEETSVSQLSDTELSLTCRVNANVGDIGIRWSVIRSPNGGQPRRVNLTNGDRFNEQRISITENIDVSGISPRAAYTLTSVLVGPNTILEDVQCTVNSPYGSRRSMPRVFQLQVILSGATIATVIIIPSVFILCVAGVLIFICWIVNRYRRCKSKNQNFWGKLGVTEPREQQRSSNQYYDGSIPPEDNQRSNSVSGMISNFLPNDMMISCSMLDISTVIGQGEFGIVYKGLLKKGTTDEVVAVKSLKGLDILANQSDVQSTIMKEIYQMKNFDHPNVMTLIGVCKANGMSGGAPSIIMPYMAQGSLLNYLRKERDQLMLGPDTDITQVGAVQKLLMQICLQISRGMAYLAKLRFVHRDLAARNCMIDENGVIKVSDFGLTEDIYMKNYFRQSSQDTHVKLPLKWMAPESIKLGIFSEKSDVWSYGVTCWEVFSVGEIPYPGIHPQAVMQLVDGGQQLNRPNNQACSDSMHRLMQSCWVHCPENRPEFDGLASSLDKELTTLADYVELKMFAENGVN